MPLFNPDYNFLIWTYLPVRRRLAAWVAWLGALVSPVRDFVSVAFQAFRNANLYTLSHDGQVCYLQAALNDTFDSTLRRIYISDPTYDDALFIYEVAELKPLWLGLVSEEGTTSYPDPEWLWLTGEAYALTGVQFIVKVPLVVFVALNMHQIKALIDKYRLPSKKNYSIVSY
jgi:hypothetical protein